MLSNMVQRTVASVAILTNEDLSKVHPDVIPRSIIVTGFEPSTTPDKLLLHFQLKQNGGGDIESITRSYRRRAVVITFRKPGGEEMFRESSNFSNELGLKIFL